MAVEVGFEPTITAPCGSCLPIWLLNNLASAVGFAPTPTPPGGVALTYRHYWLKLRWNIGAREGSRTLVFRMATWCSSRWTTPAFWHSWRDLNSRLTMVRSHPLYPLSYKGMEETGRTFTFIAVHGYYAYLRNKYGGEEGTWTLNLLYAKQMLCQLSYDPILERKTGLEPATDDWKSPMLPLHHIRINLQILHKLTNKTFLRGESWKLMNTNDINES